MGGWHRTRSLFQRAYERRSVREAYPCIRTKEKHMIRAMYETGFLIAGEPS
jgi:hypothetical protein